MPSIAALEKKIAQKEAELRQRKAAAAKLPGAPREWAEQEGPRPMPKHVYVLGVISALVIANALASGQPDLEPGMPLARASRASNPRVFLDVEIDGARAGRVVVELFENVVPLTARNFRALATGARGAPLRLKGTAFHRIVPGFMVQGGDVTEGDGRGGLSIYGPKFEDENFRLRHDEKYVLSMANSGPDTNNSQFFITVAKAPWLDGRHVVFGRVVKGTGVVDKMEVAGGGESPSRVVIADCGAVPSK